MVVIWEMKGMGGSFWADLGGWDKNLPLGLPLQQGSRRSTVGIQISGLRDARSVAVRVTSRASQL